jgi:hypothetical protein
MAFAESSLHKLYLGPSISDAEPVANSWEATRMTSDSLVPNLTSTQSAEIDPNRTPPDDIPTDAAGGGDVGYELSYNTYNTLLYSALMADSDFSGSDTTYASTTTFTTSGRTLTDDSSSADFAGIVAGDIITLPSAFTNDAGTYLVTAVASDNNSLTCLANFTGDSAINDDIVVVDDIKIGSTKHELWVEKEFWDGTSLVYSELYKNVLVGSVSLTLTPGSISSGIFRVLRP